MEIKIGDVVDIPHLEGQAIGTLAGKPMGHNQNWKGGVVDDVSRGVVYVILTGPDRKVSVRPDQCVVVDSKATLN